MKNLNAISMKIKMIFNIVLNFMFKVYYKIFID